jgi:Delta3-Delta2-enoyl-CoA isomerase
MLVLTDHGAVREIRLARPPVNAINPDLILALRQALAAVFHPTSGKSSAAQTQDGPQAVVLTGSAGCFSAGLDVPALLKLERDEIVGFWRSFLGLLSDLASAPVPVACALTGHSPAGGTVLAILTDYRVLADGPYTLGLNEVQVGLPVPEALLTALTHVVGSRQAERLAVGGLLVGPAEALRCGLVDEVAPAEEVIPRAHSFVRDLLARPRSAMLTTRARVRKPLTEAFARIDDTAIEAIVDQWFSDETLSALRKLAARLGKASV